jgi:hypothetical protein
MIIRRRKKFIWNDIGNNTISIPYGSKCILIDAEDLHFFHEYYHYVTTITGGENKRIKYYYVGFYWPRPRKSKWFAARKIMEKFGLTKYEEVVFLNGNTLDLRKKNLHIVMKGFREFIINKRKPWSLKHETKTLQKS